MLSSREQTLTFIPLKRKVYIPLLLRSKEESYWAENLLVFETILHWLENDLGIAKYGVWILVYFFVDRGYLVFYGDHDLIACTL